MINLSESELRGMMADDGERRVNFYGVVLSDGIAVRKISCTGSVNLDTEAEIQRTASLTLWEELDWLNVEIQVMEEINGKAYSLGIFLPASVEEDVSDKGLKSFSVECYDRTIRLKQSGLSQPLLIKAGTPYLDAIQQIAENAGIDSILVKDNGAFTIPSDRIFERGTSRLKVANTLLDEINYRPVYCLEDGSFVIEAFRDDIPERAGITYNETSCRALTSEHSSSLDAFNVPNVFFVTVSNQEKTYTSQYVNDDPASPFSTIRRKMEIVMELPAPDTVSSQKELDEWCARKAQEASNISETVTFRTLTMPIHGSGDYIDLDYKGHTGLYKELGWTIPLKAGDVMRHKARKVV